MTLHLKTPRHMLSDGYSLSRIIKGGWHLAGDHGAIDREQALKDMAAFVEAGVTTFDCADIYTGVEEMIGDFRRARPELGSQLQIHTKFVPDLSELDQVDAAYVERIIDRSLHRLGVEQLDVVQFHWWNFESPRYVEAALELDRQRRTGKIGRIGVTNFDTPRLAELLNAGVPVATNQVQYSLLDRRARGVMTDLCRAHDIVLLCYGTVAGGFLSERWLGRPEPDHLTNRSLIKYRLIIEDLGGWDFLQMLLGVLRQVAVKHRVDIATIATAATLEYPMVAAAIVGATSASHVAANVAAAQVRLDEEERRVLSQTRANAPELEGDVFTLERDRTGRHGRIMKYELNKT
jgi:aryl-alcohol dehydrogenase-like predicted oxidoreductase